MAILIIKNFNVLFNYLLTQPDTFVNIGHLLNAEIQFTAEMKARR